MEEMRSATCPDRREPRTEVIGSSRRVGGDFRNSFRGWWPESFGRQRGRFGTGWQRYRYTKKRMVREEERWELGCDVRRR